MVSDIDFDTGRITIIGKYDKQRVIPVGKLYPNYIANLKMFLQGKLKGNIFLSNRGRPFDVSRINQILHSVGDIANIKNPNPRKKHINPHLFRHTQSRHLKNAGFTMEFVQNYLGHKSIKTTMDIYGKASLQDMEAEAEKVRGALLLDS